jgi:hypothetical protein
MVGESSCDASGDAGRSLLLGKILPGPATPRAPPVVGSLGSRFWALVEEDSDSGDEVLTGSEQSLEESQGGSPRSLSAQRMLGDFLGPDWKLVTAAGHRRGGKRASFAPGGRCAGFSARAASSVEKLFSDATTTVKFLPLPAPAVAATSPPVSRCEVRVGSLLISLAASPEPVGCQVAAAPVLGTEQQGPPVCGDVDACRPLVEAVVVDPIG